MSENTRTIPPEHLEFIKMIAYRVWRGLSARGRMLFSIDDLVGEGYLGYVQAVRRFESGPGHRFETFAEWRIRGAMLDALRRMDQLSPYDRHRLNRLEATEQRLTGNLGRPPTEEEIATALHLTILGYLALREHCLPIEEGSLDLTLEYSPHQLPSVPDEYLEMDKRIASQQLLKQLRELLDQGAITLRTLLIMEMLLGGMERTAVAKAMGVSISRISQQLGTAVAALRTCL